MLTHSDNKMFLDGCGAQAEPTFFCKSKFEKSMRKQKCFLLTLIEVLFKPFSIASSISESFALVVPIIVIILIK